MTVPSAIAAFKRWQPLTDAIAAEIHPNRFAGIGVVYEAAKRLMANPRARLALSRHLDWLNPAMLSAEFTIGIDCRHDAWQEWEEWRVSMPDAGAAALLAGETIWRGGLRLGALLLRPEIAGLIVKSDVAFFKTAVGADGYFFALRQAGLLRVADTLRETALRGGGNEYSGSIIVQRLPEAVVRAAGLGLGCWLAGMPEGLAARVVLKLPCAADAGIALAAAWQDEERLKWWRAMRRIFYSLGDATVSLEC